MDKTSTINFDPKFTEFNGIKVGDKVKLVGVQMSDEIGKVVRVNLDRDMGKGREEMAFGVHMSDGEWWPMYRYELVKA